mmetsp:Transcript_12200/g.36615  ORF Transcript_12200/g.36615 Transcript_12200/m.36615 type:complete len:116 (+) Transcript_12200:1776-2123(+)
MLRATAGAKPWQGIAANPVQGSFQASVHVAAPTAQLETCFGLSRLLAAWDEASGATAQQQTAAAAAASGRRGGGRRGGTAWTVQPLRLDQRRGQRQDPRAGTEMLTRSVVKAAAQ